MGFACKPPSKPLFFKFTKKEGKSEELLKSKRLTKMLFVIYLLILVWVVLFKFDIPFSNMGTMQSVNLEPYAAPTRLNGEVLYSEMLLNVMIFIPLGIYLEAIFRKWPLIPKVLIVLFVSVSFEILQYIFAMGASDITDVIHNVLGGLIGLLLVKLLPKKKGSSYRFLNSLAIVTTVIVLVGLVILRVFFL